MKALQKIVVRNNFIKHIGRSVPNIVPGRPYPWKGPVTPSVNNGVVLLFTPHLFPAIVANILRRTHPLRRRCVCMKPEFYVFRHEDYEAVVNLSHDFSRRFSFLSPQKFPQEKKPH